MARTVGIGVQKFDAIKSNNYFYVDKTPFIKQWWDSGDSVTLIARPRRFGKTLAMSMTECFFSLEYAGREDLFHDLDIWKDERYRKLQGTFPVISMTFANIKEQSFAQARGKINEAIVDLYEKHSYLRDEGMLSSREARYFDRISEDMDDSTASLALQRMSGYLYKHYGKKVIILLDEYDTPMQEAYVRGYWDEMAFYMSNVFHSTFKSNPYLERGIMTGITRVSKESIFSDLNNLKVITTTSEQYADAFGFTEEEVFAAMDEYGYTEKEEVKAWYDGFTFGQIEDIYNPWSIINFLDNHKLEAYWANTSSNSLVGKLIREGGKRMKQNFEELLKGGKITANIDEQIVYDQMDGSQNAVWSLLLASGYLKVLSVGRVPEPECYGGRGRYELALTNREVRLMFSSMVGGWFRGRAEDDYNDFILALLSDDKERMNLYMNRVALETISYFDSGNQPSESEPERFYHGFVLGLIVELRDKYLIRSNRESGFGRYDVLLEPLDGGKETDAIVLEFKVFDGYKEKTLEETVCAALRQIEQKRYDAELIAKGMPKEKIRHYAFAFQGKKVLIG